MKTRLHLNKHNGCSWDQETVRIEWQWFWGRLCHYILGQTGPKSA